MKGTWKYISITGLIAFAPLTAWAQTPVGSAGGTANTRIQNWDLGIHGTPVRVSNITPALEAGYLHENGGQGATVSGRAMLRFGVGLSENRSNSYEHRGTPTQIAPLTLNPGVNLRVSSVSANPGGSPFASGSVLRTRADVSGFALLSIRNEYGGESLKRLVRIPADLAQRVAILERERNQLDQARDVVTRDLSTPDRTRTHYRLTSEIEQKSSELETANRAISDYVRDNAPAHTVASFDLLQVGFTHESDPTLGVRRNGAAIDFLSVDVQGSGRFTSNDRPTPVLIDFCARAHGRVIVGESSMHDTSGSLSVDSNIDAGLVAAACLGIGIERVGRVRNTVGVDFGYAGGSDGYFNRVSVSNRLAIEQIGGTPINVAWTYEHSETNARADVNPDTVHSARDTNYFTLGGAL